MSFEDAIAQAAAAWPDLPVPDDAFRVFAQRASDDLDGARMADLFLSFHAALGHPVAIAAITRMVEALRGPLRRTGSSAALIDELISELPTDLVAPREGAAPRIHGYVGRGPLTAWVRVIAVRALIKRRRDRGELLEDDLASELPSPGLNAELDLVRQRFAAEFRTAFASAVSRLEPGDRVLLRQHYLDGVGLDQLARLHGVHRATIGRRLASARDEIFGHIRRHLLSELKVGPDTVESILRLVHSEIELSLEQYL